MKTLTVVDIDTALPTEIFSADKSGLDSILEQVERRYGNVVFNVETLKGRKECASAAYEVARVKTRLDSMGKEAKSQWKVIVDGIDESRRHAKERLESLQAKVRAPLDEWEAAEKARVDGIKARIAALNYESAGMSSQQIAEKLASIESVAIDDSFAELLADAAKAKDGAVMMLKAALINAKAEEERIAEEVRKAEEERKAAEAARIAEAVRIAEEKAKADAQAAIEATERRAKAEAEAAASRAQAEIEAAQKRAQAEIDAAAKKAADERLAEQRKAEEEAARHRAEQEAAARRAADIEHRAAVNRAARDALVAGGVNEDTATAVVKLIAAGKIPGVKISY